MNKATVHFVPVGKASGADERGAALERLLASVRECAVFAAGERVAVKIHVGERLNVTHVKPDLVRRVVAWVKRSGARPFLTETSTLYKGERSDGIAHLEHAFRHGFTYENTGAPFLMADGLLGNSEIEVAIPGRLSASVHIAREAVLADGIVAVSHPTGHLGMGFGAAIKNLGMGLASRIGKLRQHSAVNPKVNAGACTLCRSCLRWCPEDAIVERDGKAFIIEENCTGCGECLAVCKFDAVEYDWGAESAELQKSAAEHAYGAVIGKPGKCVYVNALIDMTGDCDCMALKQKPLIPDLGFCLSLDPVAVDQATLDLTARANRTDLGRKSFPRLDPTVQLAHAEAIGLGSREYELKSL
jgi:uncharacterized Fe-S center protein